MAVSKVLILSPMLPATGNASTVYRLQNHLIKHDFSPLILCSFDHIFSSSCPVKTLNEYVSRYKVNALLILHAVKSGACLVCNCGNFCQLTVRYGVIFGGTDINQDVKDENKFQIISKCVLSSKFCVAFSQYMYDVASTLFSSIQLYQQAQALDYDVYNNYLVKTVELLQCHDLVKVKPYVLVLPCSIRPVKDPLFVAETIDKIRSVTNKDVRLLILGSVIDVDYASIFFDKLCSITDQNNNLSKRDFLANPYCIPVISGKSNCLNSFKTWLHDSNSSAVQYMPAFSRKDYMSCLSSGMFFALINTSLSEGMASSILEGMAMKVPVVARNIAGNKAIISNEKTGMLFASPEEFVVQIAKLVNDANNVTKIVNVAHPYVRTHHNPYDEANFYVSRLNQLCLR